MNLYNDYIKKLRASGHRCFTLEDGVRDLSIKRRTLIASINRAKKRGELFSPAKGLYVMIPPEHYNLKSIPADELLPILMGYWKINYYVALTTAAMYNGASHQKPQVFQIISDKQLHNPLVFGNVKIDCIYKKDLSDLPIKEVVVETGYLKVSSPEVTAMDLLIYLGKSGGLNHVATILTELVEAIDPNKLMSLINKVGGMAWVQRLGYILDNIESDDEVKKETLLNQLQNYLILKKTFYIPIATEAPILGASYCKKWMIIENATVES